MKQSVVSASEVAYILRLNLGPLRAWDDALSDMRRDKSDYEGLILKPVGMSRTNRGYRPVYSLNDVRDFIKQARPMHPEVTSPRSLLVREVEVNPSDIRPWDLRKLPVML